MVSVFMALDRSCSMSGERWSSSIEAINEYIKGLQNEKIEGTVSITAFDSLAGKQRLTNITKCSIPYFEPLKPSVLEPSGMTPLYDAVAHVMDLANQQKSERTIIVILTDGHENASVEYTREKIKTRVEQCQSKGWEVLFLGANFDVSTYTQEAGLNATKFRNVDVTNLQARTLLSSDLATATANYAKFGAEVIL